MKTPICDFVQNYIKSDSARFHMPGHKGISRLGCEALDITEIGGADVLYSPGGIIAESEENATELFGTAHSFYSAEGSSLAIRAMLTLVKYECGDKKPLILAARNAHKAFIYACAALDISVEWLYPDKFSHICECEITPKALEKKLFSMKNAPDAVYITSPDYLGRLADIRGLSAVCDKHGIPLLVDNAHGAYLNFLENSLHPIALGAAMCSDSAHKTLPVLTGGAYLHVSKKAPAEFAENARKALSLFASTSPSYLILQSLDLCNDYISDGYREKLAELVKKVENIKKHISKLGFCILEGEPLKLTVDAKKSGYTGTELAEFFEQNGVVCEFADPDYIVFMLTPENSDKDLDRLASVFGKIEQKEPLSMPDLSYPNAQRSVLSPREAILKKSRKVPLCKALGKICAAPTVACPPAVPIAVSGEVITESHIRLMEYYGLETVEIIE